MGIVYRALDTRLRRNVAIKGMLPELMGSDRSEQRFMREAQAIAKCGGTERGSLRGRGV